MNKEQFKEYRRNQRICYDFDDGWPNLKRGQAEYFAKYPLQTAPRYGRGAYKDRGRNLQERYNYYKEWDRVRPKKYNVNWTPLDSIRDHIRLQYVPY